MLRQESFLNGEEISILKGFRATHPESNIKSEQRNFNKKHSEKTIPKLMQISQEQNRRCEKGLKENKKKEDLQNKKKQKKTLDKPQKTYPLKREARERHRIRQ